MYEECIYVHEDIIHVCSKLSYVLHFAWCLDTMVGRLTLKLISLHFFLPKRGDLWDLSGMA